MRRGGRAEVVGEEPVPDREVNLLDPDLYAGDPSPVFHELRGRAPVYWHDATTPGFWALTRHEDVVRVSHDPLTFSSAARGIGVGDHPDHVPRSLITTDPPEHTRMRALVSKGFTPRMLRNLEPRIVEIANDVIDRVAPLGSCDLVADIAVRVPVAVIGDMVGVPRADQDRLVAWTDAVFGTARKTAGEETAAESVAAIAGLQAYFAELRAQRQAEPEDDMLSALLAAELDGERLDDQQLFGFFMLLILAGNETTRHLISGGLLALLEHPDQHALLRSDPTLMPMAVEELLRWVTPVIQFSRTVMRDTDLAGQRIAEGDRVIMFYPAANRDPAVFAAPDTFDIRRHPNPQLAFGFGTHFCLGASLARAETRIVLHEIMRRLPDIEVDGPVERMHSNFLNGIERAPVRFSPVT